MKRNKLTLNDTLSLDIEYKNLNFDNNISLKFKIEDFNHLFDLSTLSFTCTIVDNLSNIEIFNLDSDIDTTKVIFFKRMTAISEFQIYIPQLDIETVFVDKLLTYRDNRKYDITLSFTIKDITQRIEYNKTIKEQFIC